MTAANQLRDMISAAIAEKYGSLAAEIDLRISRQDGDRVLDVLAAASGEQRHAILRLLGYEVREGFTDQTEASP